MSYEVLARRLRPQTFSEVVGQEHVTQTLRNAVAADRLPHAILLCGPRGIGKTSIARVLARSLNCDRGPTDQPCGQCAACQEISNGSSLDVQEIDAASHTGVENVREIRDSVRYSAAPGKHRIFIIDEVHMLSSAAFNALLKTLEEPPPRSLFILATTDPQKIPATVLSRVQRYDLRRLGRDELLGRLRAIADAESLEISDDILRGLIREGGGSFRDVLTLLERLISGLGTQIRDEDARRLLDWVDRRILEDLIDPVLAHDPAAVLSALERAIAKGVEPARLAADLLSLLRDLLVVRLVPDPGPLVEATADQLEALRERAARASPELLQQLFRVLLTRMQDLSLAPNPVHALEVALVRLATLPDSDSVASLMGRIDALLAGGAPPPPTPPGARSAAPRASASRGGGRDAVRAAPRARPSAPRPTPRAQDTEPTPRTSAEPQSAAARSDSAESSDGAPSAPEPPRKIGAVSSATGRAAEQHPAAQPGQSGAHAAESAADPAAAAANPAPDPRPEVEPTVRRAPLDPEEHKRLHRETKEHPAVRAVIETLDAEIYDIRMPRR